MQFIPSSFADHLDNSGPALLRWLWVLVLVFIIVWMLEICTSITPFLFALLVIRVCIIGNTQNIVEIIFFYIGWLMGAVWAGYELY